MRAKHMRAILWARRTERALYDMVDRCYDNDDEGMGDAAWEAYKDLHGALAWWDNLPSYENYVIALNEADHGARVLIGFY
jgi:hypothetical protein